MSVELGERGDPVLKLPFPIVPESGRHIRPITQRMRDELFSVAIPCGKSVHFIEGKNAKAVNNRVNAGTSLCATHSAARLPLMGIVSSPSPACQSESLRRAYAQPPRAAGCSRAMLDNSVPLRHAFRNRGS